MTKCKDQHSLGDPFDFGWGGSFKSLPKRCYESHPALDLGVGKIYGGSCGHPVVTDADIYVGLDLSISKSDRAFPWEQGESFLFYIPDMGVPASPAQFRKLVEWMAVQLTAQRKIHVGCIGGHGRTGMVLSALVKEVLGVEDAISYVRKNYCSKAVESSSQVEFLVKHFGVRSVRGAKVGGLSGGFSPAAYPSPLPVKPVSDSRRLEVATLPKSSTAIPAKNPSLIWGPEISFDKQ